jgi:thiol:disulfide interchange protein DsbG
MFTSAKTRAPWRSPEDARKIITMGTFRMPRESIHLKPVLSSLPSVTSALSMTPASSSPRPVQRQRLHLLGLPLVAAAAATLAACSKPDDKAEATAPAGLTSMSPEQAYEKVAMDGKGFVVGSLMSANPVFVLFDPQCPHCGHLWGSSQPLLNKVKFVWIPVSFINGKSAPQGAAILSAANPAEFMASHEASLLAGTGGAPLSGSMTPEMEATIKANTVLFNSLKVESVPYVIAKNPKTGAIVTNAGAMETAALATFLGV